MAIWKTKLDRAEFINQSGHLYRYAVKLLAEKVSWFVSLRGGSVRIVCAESQSAVLGDIKRELAIALNNRLWSVRPVFDPEEIIVSTPAIDNMLCLADATASSFGNALNPKRDGKHQGTTEPIYSRYFVPNIFRMYGKRFKYGIKNFPDTPKYVREFKAAYPALRFWF